MFFIGSTLQFIKVSSAVGFITCEVVSDEITLVYSDRLPLQNCATFFFKTYSCDMGLLVSMSSNREILRGGTPVLG